MAACADRNWDGLGGWHARNGVVIRSSENARSLTATQNIEETETHGEDRQRSAGTRFDGRREATRAAEPDRKRERQPVQSARAFRSGSTALVGVLRSRPVEPLDSVSSCLRVLPFPPSPPWPRVSTEG